MKKISLLVFGMVFLIIGNQAQTVIDYDGNSYDTVIIDNMVWMKQNLKVTHYNDGSQIPNITNHSAWSELTNGARCYFNNDSLTYSSIYGALYNEYAVNTGKLCPGGWHVSSNNEWLSTEIFLGGSEVAGGKMKEAGFGHWTSPNTGATNDSKFTGLPGGMRDPVNNKFSTIGENGLWWTTSTSSGSMVWSTYLWYLYAGVDHNPTPKNYGLSIRCIKDIKTELVDIYFIDYIKIYPNPVNSQISVELVDCKSVSIQIFNTLGEELFQFVSNDYLNKIDVSKLSRGIYIIKLSGTDWTTNKKFFKE